MEPIIHALIPLVFLLALFPKLDKKYIFYLLPIVWIVDLDTFIGSTHRFLFHNIFFVLLIVVALYFIWDKRAAIVGAFYGFSHLILDLAYPGLALFYPITDTLFYVESTIQRGTTWILNFGIATLSKEEFLAFVGDLGPLTYATEAAFLFLILFIILLVIKFRKEIKAFFSKAA